LEIHQQFLAKSAPDRNLSDTGDLVKEFKLFWAMLADKGYKGAENRIRAFIPTKNPQEKHERQHNQLLGGERVICENC